MKLTVIEGFVVPVAVPEDAAGDLYETDMDGLMVFLAGTRAEPPKLFSVNSVTFEEMDREKLGYFLSQVGDHPAMKIVAEMSEAYAAEQAKKSDDVFAEFVTKITTEITPPAVGKAKK